MKPTRILFVCTGNICRSPTAEAVLRARAVDRGLGDVLLADSAGTEGYHIGQPPDPRSVAAAARRGIGMDHLRARRVSAADFNRFDWLVAMDSSHFSQLQRLAPPDPAATLAMFSQGHDIADPYYGGPAGFERVLDEIEAGVAQWLDRLMLDRTRS